MLGNFTTKVPVKGGNVKPGYPWTPDMSTWPGVAASTSGGSCPGVTCSNHIKLSPNGVPGGVGGFDTPMGLPVSTRNYAQAGGKKTRRKKHVKKILIILVYMIHKKF